MKKEDIKLNFLHICDYASFSKEGKLNILGVFKDIKIRTIPAVHPQLFIVSNIISIKHADFKETIKIIDDENNEIIKSLEFNLKSASSRKEKQAEFGIVAQINNIKFDKVGQYKVEVFIDEELIGETILNVSKMTPSI